MVQKAGTKRSQGDEEKSMPALPGVTVTRPSTDLPSTSSSRNRLVETPVPRLSAMNTATNHAGNMMKRSIGDYAAG